MSRGFGVLRTFWLIARAGTALQKSAKESEHLVLQRLSGAAPPNSTTGVTSALTARLNVSSGHATSPWIATADRSAFVVHRSKDERSVITVSVWTRQIAVCARPTMQPNRLRMPA
jgi:hypothetical protein